MDRYGTKIKHWRERLSLDTKFNNAVFNVHEKLRERQNLPKPSKAKPKPNKIKPKESIQKTNENTLINCVNSLHNIKYNNIGLPRVKVLCSNKRRKLIHKSTETSPKSISLEDHKRIMRAAQRKDKLEKMLTEHKILKENRQSLEYDIFAMRHSLDHLQHRINNCLKHLNNKQTYCECHGLRGPRKCKKCTENQAIDIAKKP